MTREKKIAAVAVVAVLLAVAVVLGSMIGKSAASQAPKAPRKPPVAAPAKPKPTPTKTVTVTPSPPAPQQAAPAPQAPPAPADPAPAPAPRLTNGVAVVLQFYQDLNNQDYTDAWNLGGDNLNGGTGYSAWVAGYATTASISVTSYGTWNDGTVWTDINAVQTDGTVKTYSGTYTVANGVIVSANITQTS